jgi:hypothetical protein
MKRPRRNHTAVFEAKVALAALRVDGKRDVLCLIIWITTSPAFQPRSPPLGRPAG